MICKWCGETLKTGAKTCRRCKREIPAKSDCGGFYDLVPHPGTQPPAVPTPAPVMPAMPESAPYGAAAPGKKKRDMNPKILFAGAAALILILLVMVISLSGKLEEANDLVFRVKHSDSKYIITSKFQLPKIRAVLPECPLVEKVIIFDEVADKRENEMYIDEIIAMGDEFLAKNEELFIQRYKSIGPDDYANISYTSGTTADPKGILLTHRNYTANVEQAHSVIGVDETDRMLIILPLDHCFAHVAGFYTMMSYGASIGTVPSGKNGKEALRNISPSIQELKPHVMLSVPTLAKNFKKNIETAIAKKGKTIEKLYNFALNNAIAYHKEGYNRGTEFVDIFRKPLLGLFDKLIFKSVRQGLGGNMKFFVGGGALLDIDLQKFRLCALLLIIEMTQVRSWVLLN
jgi:long-chain acyl-CoA synthetase